MPCGLAVLRRKGYDRSNAGYFFPDLALITSGFEHSVANMYYIPAGIMAKVIPEYAAASKLSAEMLASLNWHTFFVHNLIPVTLGNIIGGAFFVACLYSVCYKTRS